MTTTVLEAWEVLPDKQGPVERFTLPPSGSTLFVVYPDSNRRQPMHEELRLVDALRAQVADSTVVFLPP